MSPSACKHLPLWRLQHLRRGDGSSGGMAVTDDAALILGCYHRCRSGGALLAGFPMVQDWFQCFGHVDELGEG